MPSTRLSALSNEIEDQDTGHFAKFYMYASLLSVVTVKNTYKEAMPTCGTSFFSSKEKNLYTGDLSAQFYSESYNYARQFENKTPSYIKVATLIVKAYSRKGQLADLAFMIEQMLGHLTAIQTEPENKNNKEIYQKINFDSKKSEIHGFIKSLSDLNQQSLSCIDNSINSAIYAVAATTGLIIVLSSSLSLMPFLIGTAMIGLGAYNAYSCFEDALIGVEQIKEHSTKIGESIAELPKNNSLFGNGAKNDNAFILSSLLKPAMYTAVTVKEQLAFDEKSASAAEEARQGLDTTIEILAP